MPITLADILEAQARIRNKVVRTPIMTSGTLSDLADAKLFFKCENLQKVGTFKARGAINAVFSLTDEEVRRGVVTHSSGNHAASLARAAKLRGIPSYAVMPATSPQVKQASVLRNGGEIVLCEPTPEARERTAKEVVARTGAVFVHSSDDLRVMAGQGTTALEILEAVPAVDFILCPVGGGGLLGGVAVAAKRLKPEVKIIGVEPATADDAARSLRAGHIVYNVHPNTIADGLVTSLGEHTFFEIQRYVDDIVTVSEESIIAAMRRMWEIMKLVVEPSGAVSYAAVIERGLHLRGKNVVMIVSGGNLDLDALPW